MCINMTQIITVTLLHYNVVAAVDFEDRVVCRKCQETIDAERIWLYYSLHVI